MLNLFQSNRMHTLVHAFCERQAGSTDPFESTLVVVQSFGIGQWLKVQLAERKGIAANVDCILPAELIWRLYRSVLPVELPDTSPFSRDLITWRLMSLLDSQTGASFQPIRDYLERGDKDPITLYQLCHTVAGLFDQYLLYRPDWILKWENGQDAPDAPWQSQLWRTLVTTPGMNRNWHRAHLHQAFLAALAAFSVNKPGQDTLAAKGIPNRFSVFGLSSLPAMHLDSLQGVSEFVDVDVFFLNPCQHYWGDIVSEKSLAKRSIRTLLNTPADIEIAEEAYLEVGNPLLSSMGRQGREFFEQLLDAPAVNPIDLFDEQPPTTVLGQVKNDILNLEFGGALFDPDKPPSEISLDPQDVSLEVHCCHSKQREVEILLDQIYAMFDSDQGLTPADIMVMAPDINDYAPFINAVFRGKLPYSITDRPLSQAAPIFAPLNRLLELPLSRLTATEVIDLLEMPAVARRMALTETDIARITDWVRRANIRFEMDAETKSINWGIPAENQNTWRFGLDRLLLGYAMQEEAGPYREIAPLDPAPGEPVLLGKLCQLLTDLQDFRQRLSVTQPAESWQQLIEELLESFIQADTNEEYALNSVRDALARLSDLAGQAGFQGDLSPRLARHWMAAELSESSASRGFVTGGITFATLVPMRSIPYDVVCLIGMNDRDFPREHRPLSFDLMTAEYRKGDRSRRKDDRYLFLEALLSAEKRFYLSYEGRSLKDNKPKPPSVLVAELQDYLERLYGTRILTEHPLQPFSPVYFSREAGAPRSYQTTWFEALKADKAESAFLAAPLSGADQFQPDQLRQLTDFFRHPAKYFLRQRLGVWFKDQADTLQDIESFELNAIERYTLADGALQTLLAGTDINTFRSRVLASGFVLPGQEGQQQLDQEISRAQAVFSAFEAMSPGKARNVSGEVDLGDIIIAGQVGCFGNVFYNLRPGKLRQRQILDVWIQHLFLCSQGEADTSTMIAEEGKTQTFNAVKAEDARVYLKQLAGLYMDGLTRALPFLPEASWAVAKSSESDPALLKSEFLAAYTGNERSRTEIDDRYNQRVFDFSRDVDEEFLAIAKLVYQPITEALGDGKP